MNIHEDGGAPEKDQRLYCATLICETWDEQAREAGQTDQTEVVEQLEDLSWADLEDLQGAYGFDEASSSHLAGVPKIYFRTTAPREDRAFFEKGEEKFYSLHIDSVNRSAPTAQDYERIGKYLGISFRDSASSPELGLPEFGTQRYGQVVSRLRDLRAAIYKPERIDARVEAVRVLFENDIADPGDHFASGGAFTSRDFYSIFEMGDGEQVRAAIMALARQEPEGPLARCVAHHGWERQAYQQAFGQDAVNVFCEYDDPHSAGAVLSITFMTPSLEKAHDTLRRVVREGGYAEVYSDDWREVPPTFFVEQRHPASFADATALPRELFEYLDERYEADCEPIRLHLRGADSIALFNHLEHQVSTGTLIGPFAVVKAREMAITRAGEVRPMWTRRDDAGKVVDFKVTLPTPGESVEDLDLIQLGELSRPATKP